MVALAASLPLHPPELPGIIWGSMVEPSNLGHCFLEGIRDAIRDAVGWWGAPRGLEEQRARVRCKSTVVSTPTATLALSTSTGTNTSNSSNTGAQERPPDGHRLH